VEKLGLEAPLAIGAVRAALQLIGIGYLLSSVFAHPSPLVTFALLGVMIAVAAFTSARRVEHGPGTRVLLPHALLALLLGSGVALVPVFVFILPVHPWFDARYVIPLSGMIVANAMNVVSLVFERVFAAAHVQSSTLEQLLALGASPRQALRSIVRAAVRAALLPTINGLTTVGLVALPGMMTGQILAGASPLDAVRYQLVIMYQLVVVAAVAGLCAARSAERVLFTDRAVLSLPKPREKPKAKP
jgi:putative ABC transport system permease protein